MKNKKIHILLMSTLLLASCGYQRYYQPSTVVTKPNTSVSPSTTEPANQSAATTTATKHRTHKDCLWGDIDYDGEPWVKKVSRPYSISHGLQNRHIALWQSHGRYYDQEKAKWKWQRPNLFGTTEDLFTQTFVVPYLIPMLENAGANVFTPRERDWQRNEIIVDNDSHASGQYTETNSHAHWEDGKHTGFAFHSGWYKDGENPFEAGTTRKAKAAKTASCEISYQPNIPESGSYAVYVSYPPCERNVDDACYTVHHKGQTTVFHVNQQMGSSTWVYLGTFDFDKGCNAYNRVTLTNQSQHKGYVTADAVRFGGGMGNIERGDTISGYPRFLEGARYWGQWAGVPYSKYSHFKGVNDYRDDIYVRSFMTNWLGGGSCYMPDSVGKNVPFEAVLAVHSDAGWTKDFRSLTGSLGIYYTKVNDGVLHAGIPRQSSGTMISHITNYMKNDLAKKFGEWVIRDVRDDNYAENRCPDVPSAIIETLSHQNFPDMRLGMDPNFKFTLARSIYKGLLRFINEAHGDKYVVSPLAPDGFRMEYKTANKIKLEWDAVEDGMEPTATPSAYVLYMAAGSSDFDNGTVVKGKSCNVELQPNVVYRFKVCALNEGGESFPSHTLSAIYHPGATKTIMIVDGFSRLSAPAVKENANEQGFDFSKDPGVSYIRTAGICGPQVDFDKKNAGLEGPGAMGYSSNEWAGMVIAGNTFDNVYDHAEAMKGLLDCNVLSCTSEAVERGYVNLNLYHLVDMLLGLQKKDDNQHIQYKTFSKRMQQLLSDYTTRGGSLLASGAYIGSDMQSFSDSIFMSKVFKTKFDSQTQDVRAETINGMGTSIKVYNQLNEEHYAAIAMDVVTPLEPAFASLSYANGLSAAVAYQGNDYRSFIMGFPFECITNYRKRAAIMKGVVTFLMGK